VERKEEGGRKIEKNVRVAGARRGWEAAKVEVQFFIFRFALEMAAKGGRAE